MTSHRSSYPPPSSNGDSYYPPSSLQDPPRDPAPHHTSMRRRGSHSSHQETSHHRPQHNNQHNRHASAEKGALQGPPKLGNQFVADIALRRVLALYIAPEINGPLYHDLAVLGDAVVGTPMLRYLEDAERNPSKLVSTPPDAFGQHTENTELRTSEGWRRLLEIGAKEGCVAEGYGGELGRIGQFARYYIFCPSSALVTCPFAMSDGAARLLQRHLVSPRPAPQTQALDFTAVTLTEDEREAETSRRVFKRAYNRLISRFPNIRWTSGQWMTERPGGQQDARTETTAAYKPFSGPMADRPEQEMGPWVVNGHKFFSSATDSDMTILLARTEGSKKLSAFYAPMKTPSGDNNGVKITRLTPKAGTRALPSAEIELKGMRAWLIGQEGDGIREISTILGITRVHNSVCAVSFMRRALSVAKAYSQVRQISGGRLLRTTPMHIRTLAHMELLTRAATHLAFLNVYLLSLSENAATTPVSSIYVPPQSAHKLLRLLTPLTKAVTTKLSISVLSETVEALGGIGLLENEEPLNLARLLRDAQVLSVWEGTTDVLITDLVMSLKRPSPDGREERTYALMGEFLRENLGEQSGGFQGDAGDVLERCKLAIWTEWEALEHLIEGGSREELVGAGRRILWRLAWVVVGTMLLVDARRDGDGAAVEAARRWVTERAGLVDGKIGGATEKESAWDAVLVFGAEDKAERERERSGHRL